LGNRKLGCSTTHYAGVYVGISKKFGAGASSLKLLNLVIVDQTMWSKVGI